MKKVFAAGIFPPSLPLIGRRQFLARLQDKTALAFGRLTRPLDGTRLAELLGLYYFACAEKPVDGTGEGTATTKAAANGRAA